MKLIFLGKPSSGKGTQSKLVAEKLDYKHISTGDLLREEVKKGSKIGLEAKGFMENGALVPDSLIINLLKLRLPKDNYILDGFPRTLEQAKELENIVKIDFVVEVNCSDESIIKRTINRRLCPKCCAIYGLNAPTKKKGYCDKDGEKLYKRADDNEQTIKKRLKVYEKQTKPLLKFYEKILFKVNGELPIEEVQKKIIERIK